MGRWKYVWPMCLTMVLHGVAIFIFTKGFLLTRTELPNHSHCSDASQSPCFPSSTSYFNGNLSGKANSSQKEETCWTKPVINRLVIIVLDALRFDFLAPSTFFKESKPWMDNLQVLAKLASTNGSSARIFKAIADPPTTSLQRLKGLTTGGLPTFIDVGDSFGAPAIIEDNFIHQLVKNGRKVVMMGDDTWMQLFPHHFEKSYPYPSFNVKDLDTVDNGCIEHLLPSLYEEDWDVLISHFLGVDHAGHIFGVDSSQMIEKLKQYNNILEEVIEVLQSQSGPGGIHQNTFLVVMGDHGQTLNGDHGGGSDEEVDTAIFAMSFREPASLIPLEFDTSSCQPNLDGKNVCISAVQQLDFAVTMSALLGIPFPFGSIGQVNPELYALGADSWKSESLQMENTKQSNLEEWVRDYVNVLCINSWQVKKYIDIYSASSVLGFSYEDMLDIADVYAKAEQNWSNNIKKLLLKENNSDDLLLPALKKQIDAYTSFLQNFANLARSKWTEFDLRMMCAGIGIMLASLIFQLLIIKRLDEHDDFQSSKDTGMCSGSMLACFIVVIRAGSFLSNSFILEEGKVAIFLLATTGILKLRYSIIKENMLQEGIIFLIVCTFCRFAIEVGLSKQAATSAFMKEHTSWVLNLASWFSMWSYIAEVVPMLTLVLLGYLLFKAVSNWSIDGIYKYIILTSITSYVLIALQWASESNLLGLALWFEGIGRSSIPRLIYGITVGQLSLLMICVLFRVNASLLSKKDIITKALAALSAWSSTIMLLSGKQGPVVALASLIGGYCILRLESFQQRAKDKTGGSLNIGPFPVMQWSLLAVILFFCTGHWCAFDGLRYGAAFIGFDDFILFRQAILLGLDTFGFSIVLPVFGLALLVAYGYRLDETNQKKHLLLMKLSQVYMTYGLITATAVTATIMCVTIQRRHLMVWGLFAPKFCFDVIGLATTDILICLACLYYLSQANDD